MNLIVAMYADTLKSTDPDKPAVQPLIQELPRILPKGTIVHLLPFLRSSGDGGFALDSWSRTNRKLAEWEDIRRLAENYRLVVDGVFNHVGAGHPWFKAFVRDPQRYSEYFHAHRSDALIPSPRSPRGGPALRRNLINGELWQLWQTFDASAFDINLDNAKVKREIAKFIDRLCAHCVYGIRLDAPAYFGKDYVGPMRHSKASYRLAREVAAQVSRSGLALYPQLDCDDDARQYFQVQGSPHIPVIDYTFPAYLYLSIEKEDPMILRDHLKVANSIDGAIMRPMRTHDGILLRSTMISDDHRESILSMALGRGVQPRIIDGFPYELNCSFPHLMGFNLDDSGTHDGLQLAIALTLISPGIPYIYLPALLGYVPENQDCNPRSVDPRQLNRRPILIREWDALLASSHGSVLRKLIDTISDVQNLRAYGDQASNAQISVFEGCGLLILQDSPGFFFAANFSKTRTIPSPALMGRTIIFGELDGGAISPRRFIIAKSTIKNET